MLRSARSIAALALLTLLPLTAAAQAEQWMFKVRLDDKTIGRHSFVRTGDNSSYVMDIRADFKATLFLVVPFRYEHQNKESWSGDCLTSIESVTNDNGDSFKVSGAVATDHFSITANGKQERLPACVSTFAYWDKRFLQQASLLNSQDGTFSPVTTRDMGEEVIKAFGKQMTATRHRVKAGDLTIYLWYSSDGDWLRLESPVKGGMTLIYERVSP